jgi:hypothetical protein
VIKPTYTASCDSCLTYLGVGCTLSVDAPERFETSHQALSSAQVAKWHAPEACMCGHSRKNHNEVKHRCNACNDICFYAPTRGAILHCTRCRD